jgi:SAM-dependent methyltransferase
MPQEDSQFSKQNVGGVFARQAVYYAGERGRSPWFQAQLKIVIDMLESQCGLILDIGCAAGAEVEPLRARGFRIVAVDYSEEMLRFANERFGGLGGVHFCRADAESLPFASASFDHVVCLGVFEYLSTYDRCLVEIHRVLRPGGVLIISVPSRVSLHRFSHVLFSLTAVPLWRAIKKLAGKPSSGKPLGGQWNRCIPWQLPRQLLRHGFSPEQSAHSGFLLFPLGEVWPAAELRLFRFMERFSQSRLLGWTLSQYLIRGRKGETR